MKYKEALLLIMIASILLAGCAPNAKDTTKASIAGDKAEAPHNVEASDDDQPPALPGGSEVLQTEPDEQPPEEDSADEPPAAPPDENKETGTPAAPPANPGEFVGLWRVFSSRLFYDAGGGGAVGTGTGQPLELNSDGTWQLSASAGTWAVENISEEDWKAWNVNSYGPDRKIVLDNWNGATASGPVEESGGRVDFFWMIYRAEPPTVSSPGQVQAKYGHAN